jgi:hypothetical protein
MDATATGQGREGSPYDGSSTGSDSSGSEAVEEPMAGADDRPDDRSDANGHGGLLSPVSLALDVLSGGVRLVRELPETAARLPVRGLNLALTLTEKVQRQASTIQHRGTQVLDLIAALRGGRDDALDVDEALARAREQAPDYGVTATVADLTERAAQRVEDAAGRVSGLGTQPDVAEPGAAEPAAPRRSSRPTKAPGKPTTKRSATGPRQPAKRARTRPQLAPDAVDAGAPGAASEVAARAERAAESDRVIPGDQLSAAELPLSDFDQLSIGSLRSRLPRLDRDQLVQLLAYERAHADRLQVVTMIENRIAKVEHDAGGAGGAQPAAARPRKATAKKAAAKPAKPAKKAASATPGGTDLDQPVAAPDETSAQEAAEDFGSNSPHP